MKSSALSSLYLAYTHSDHRYTALTLFHPELTEARTSPERMEQALTMARFGPHRPEMIASGVDGVTGIPWTAIEWLTGETLAQQVERDGPCTVEQTLWIMGMVAEALSYAHDRGKLHEDLRPTKLLLSPRLDSKPPSLHVLGFGIAEWFRMSGAPLHRYRNPLWLAPELNDDRTQPGIETDIWSFGLLAFFVLTGRSYWCTSEDALRFQIMNETHETALEPPSKRIHTARFSSLRPSPVVETEAFDDWFFQCVQRSPSARFSSVEEALESLRFVLRHAAAPHPHASSIRPAFAATDRADGVFSSLRPIAFSRPPPRPPLRWVSAGLLAAVVSGVGLALALDPRSLTEEAATHVSSISATSPMATEEAWASSDRRVPEPRRGSSDARVLPGPRLSHVGTFPYGLAFAAYPPRIGGYREGGAGPNQLLAVRVPSVGSEDVSHVAWPVLWDRDGDLTLGTGAKEQPIVFGGRHPGAELTGSGASARARPAAFISAWTPEQGIAWTRVSSGVSVPAPNGLSASQGWVAEVLRVEQAEVTVAGRSIDSRIGGGLLAAYDLSGQALFAIPGDFVAVHAEGDHVVALSLTPFASESSISESPAATHKLSLQRFDRQGRVRRQTQVPVSNLQAQELRSLHFASANDRWFLAGQVHATFEVSAKRYRVESNQPFVLALDQEQATWLREVTHAQRDKSLSTAAPEQPALSLTAVHILGDSVLVRVQSAARGTGNSETKSSDRLLFIDAENGITRRGLDLGSACSGSAQDAGFPPGVARPGLGLQQHRGEVHALACRDDLMIWSRFDGEVVSRRLLAERYDGVVLRGEEAFFYRSCSASEGTSCPRGALRLKRYALIEHR
ncbi:MAG: protein kinase [Myxococcota bacterium]